MASDYRLLRKSSASLWSPACAVFPIPIERHMRASWQTWRNFAMHWKCCPRPRRPPENWVSRQAISSVWQKRPRRQPRRGQSDARPVGKTAQAAPVLSRISSRVLARERRDHCHLRTPPQPPSFANASEARLVAKNHSALRRPFRTPDRTARLADKTASLAAAMECRQIQASRIKVKLSWIPSLALGTLAACRRARQAREDLPEGMLAIQGSWP